MKDYIENMALAFLKDYSLLMEGGVIGDCKIVNQEIHITQEAAYDDFTHEIDLVEFLAWIYSKVNV